MRVRTTVLALGTWVGLSAAEAQEQFLCVGTKATGFEWSGKDWVQRNFKVDDDKWLVQEVKPRELRGESFNYEASKLGENRGGVACQRQKGSSRILCGGLAHGILIDVETMRYHEVYGFGYIDGQDRDGNTPAITLGKCTRIK
jgi:hypothetical protein